MKTKVSKYWKNLQKSNKSYGKKLKTIKFDY